MTGRYRVLLVDPPWRFRTYSHKGLGRSAEAHYDCMSLDDIKAMPVASMAADDAVLLMWVTDPFLRQGLDVIDAWGFTYKTIGFVWVKQNVKSPETNPCRRSQADHSAPPASLTEAGVYDRIERPTGGPYIELFARNTRPGWDSTGDEVDTGPGARRWRYNGCPEAAA